MSLVCQRDMNAEHIGEAFDSALWFQMGTSLILLFENRIRLVFFLDLVYNI